MKYCGTIGFVKSVEIRPGVWTPEAVERKYTGDFSKVSRRTESSDSVNDNINISNELSILADPYARENFFAMRYATYMGVKWKITNVTVAYPRLNLTLGGEYHEETS